MGSIQHASDAYAHWPSVDSTPAAALAHEQKPGLHEAPHNEHHISSEDSKTAALAALGLAEIKTQKDDEDEQGGAAPRLIAQPVDQATGGFALDSIVTVPETSTPISRARARRRASMGSICNAPCRDKASGTYQMKTPEQLLEEFDEITSGGAGEGHWY